MSSGVAVPNVVSKEAWLDARQALLVREKALTRQRDEVSRLRRELPWVRVEKPYVFDTLDGPKTLGELFDGRSQLIVYHFMFGPGWGEGCVGCSLLADHLTGPLMHLGQHDVSLAVVSRASLREIEPFRTRMGWTFNWVSSNRSDFNYDFHVSFRPEEMAAGHAYTNFGRYPVLSEETSGTSVFCKDAAGDVFHTYSSYSRGGEGYLGIYHLLDQTPKGRNETGRGNLSDWVRHHDRYGARGTVAASGRYQPEAATESGSCCEHE